MAKVEKLAEPVSAVENPTDEAGDEYSSKRPLKTCGSRNLLNLLCHKYVINMIFYQLCSLSDLTVVKLSIGGMCRIGRCDCQCPEQHQILYQANCSVIDGGFDAMGFCGTKLTKLTKVSGEPSCQQCSSFEGWHLNLRKKNPSQWRLGLFVQEMKELL